MIAGQRRLLEVEMGLEKAYWIVDIYVPYLLHNRYIFSLHALKIPYVCFNYTNKFGQILDENLRL